MNRCTCDTPGCGRPYKGTALRHEGRYCARCTLARRRQGAGNFGTFHRAKARKQRRG